MAPSEDYRMKLMRVLGNFLLEIGTINRNSKDQIGRASEHFKRTFLDSLPGTSKILGDGSSGDKLRMQGELQKLTEL